MPKKKSVLFYLDNYTPSIKNLSYEQKGMLFDAFVSYAGGNADMPENMGLLSLAFDPIKAAIDRSNEKYEKICARNRANGKKGGRPNGKKEAENDKSQDNPEKPSGFSKDADNGNGEPNKTEDNPEKPSGFQETQNNPEKPSGLDSDNKEPNKTEDNPEKPSGFQEENDTDSNQGTQDNPEKPSGLFSVSEKPKITQANPKKPDSDSDSDSDSENKNSLSQKTQWVSNGSGVPTVEEVIEYCKFKKYVNVDPVYFFQYYQEREWRMRDGRKIFNFKFILDKWETNNFGDGTKNHQNNGLESIEDLDYGKSGGF